MTLALEPPPSRTRSKPRRRRALRFFVIVIALLVALDFYVRLNFKPYFHEVNTLAAQGPVDMIFLGTSRVAAAVDADTFAENLPGTHSTIVNAGMGYTTPAEYFMALRNTLEAHPESFRHLTLFLEMDGGAAGGIPDYSAWSDPWTDSARPELISPFLQGSDVARYWGEARPFEDNLQLSLDFLLRSSALYTQRHAVGTWLFTDARSRVAKILQFLDPPPSSSPATRADLASAGGIRSDSEGVALARQSAADHARRMTDQQLPIDWNHTIIADIVNMAQAHDVQIIFFEVPLHPMHKAIYETPTRLADAENFRAQAALWHTAILIPDFATTEDDFPDIWHLRRSRAQAYTRALARSYASTQ